MVDIFFLWERRFKIDWKNIFTTRILGRNSRSRKNLGLFCFYFEIVCLGPFFEVFIEFGATLLPILCLALVLWPGRACGDLLSDQSQNLQLPWMKSWRTTDQVQGWDLYFLNDVLCFGSVFFIRAIAWSSFIFQLYWSWSFYVKSWWKQSLKMYLCKKLKTLRYLFIFSAIFGTFTSEMIPCNFSVTFVT